MKTQELARDNHSFFYVDLPMSGLFSSEFQELWDRAARRARYALENPDMTDRNDAITQMPFQCRNGELGYLRFKDEDAKTLSDAGIDLLRLAGNIPSGIGGETNQKCTISAGNGITISFAITAYEWCLDGDCMRIEDPLKECPDPVPLGRKVELAILRG